MSFFYTTAIYLYYLIVFILSAFNSKAKLWIKGRKDLFRQLRKSVEKDENIIWFHASSLGEFEQGRPLIEALKKEDPEQKILLTFFSPSGFEVRKNYDGADYIHYLPLDTKKNAKRFVKIVNPKAAIFIKYEFWYHFLKQLKKNESSVILVSGIFRQDQMFFRKIGVWYRKLLFYFDHFFVQDQNSAELLKGISLKNITVAGDTRFDRVNRIAGESAGNTIVSEFTQGKFTFVCGSTWERDEEILISFLEKTREDCRVIIAPHEISISQIGALTTRLEPDALLYSKANPENISDKKVMIIDNIGMLSMLYKYGDVAYIGGGFGSGIHNILEAAVYGIPVVFGPNYQKFREAHEILKAGGGFSVSNAVELNKVFNELIRNKEKLKFASKQADNYIQKNLGATDIIMNYLKMI
ncbi:MAG: 3-deoxy-D-manno-octulosonic acid transferase [Bacteroidales bacterium]|nr:3-deoxy-D-manno-octulosonic acid transferase [Bacteroidales bacterium]